MSDDALKHIDALVHKALLKVEGELDDMYPVSAYLYAARRRIKAERERRKEAD